MSYCLNPQCQKPQNPDDPQMRFCQNCGARLILKDTYQAIAPLGQGGMGRTFRGIDRDNFNAPCAIKQFLPQLQNPQAIKKAVELFAREAEQLHELGKHPQIPQLLAYFEQDGCLYLIQELIEGQNLQDELQERGTFNEQQIRGLLSDLLPVLRFIHERNVIHRDIKPENIIRRRTPPQSSPYPNPPQSPSYQREVGDLVLVDFGAAKVITGKDLSKTGTVIGSPEYTAPEQTRGKAIPASDIYSLGVTCIYLLTNVRPFDLYNDVDDVWMWQQYLTIPVSKGLGFILDKMLARATSNRYESAAAVLQDLDRQPGSLHGSSARSLPGGSGAVADYTHLRDFLAVGDWQAGDRETTRLILALTGRDKLSHLKKEDIENFPCIDLQTIDRLWESYSNGRFGFSVQRRIWESLGGLLFYDSDRYWKFAKTYLKFASRVGWVKKSWFFWFKWLKHRDFNFTLKAPKGHLPGFSYQNSFELIDCFFLRLKICQDS